MAWKETTYCKGVGGHQIMHCVAHKVHPLLKQSINRFKKSSRRPRKWKCNLSCGPQIESQWSFFVRLTLGIHNGMMIPIRSWHKRMKNVETHHHFSAVIIREERLNKKRSENFWGIGSASSFSRFCHHIRFYETFLLFLSALAFEDF